MADHRAIFTPLYAQHSGRGSTLEHSAPYRAFLERFIADHRIRSIVDLGCGDLQVMSHVDLAGAIYLGADVIEERVAANRIAHPDIPVVHRDIRTWDFPDADLVLCKDVLQHWTNAEVESWIADLLERDHRFEFALLTNDAYEPVNTDIQTGGCRSLDLTREPFSIGEVVFTWRRKATVLVRGRRF